MATSDSKDDFSNDDFWDRMRESEPDIFKAFLWCRLIPQLHEEYPCTNTKTAKHQKSQYTKWILKYQHFFEGISDAPYIKENYYYKAETLQRIQESYGRVINLSRLLDEDFDYSKFLFWRTRLNIPTEKVWDFEDLDRALDVKLKLHSGDIEKCENLREAHKCLCQYVQFNINFMDKHIREMDKENASQAWLEEYADFKTREKECDESGPNLDDGNKEGRVEAKKKFRK